MQISDLSLYEKASLLCGSSFLKTHGIGTTEGEHYLPQMSFADGGTGINYEQLCEDLFGDKASEWGLDKDRFDFVVHNFYKPEVIASLPPAEKKAHQIMSEEITKYRNDITLAPGCYPAGIMAASTWNRQKIEELGNVLADEARSFKRNCLLGTPNCNLLKDPLNGRYFEAWSEDAWLSGELSRNMVKGIEDKGVCANVKHYIANNLEFNRIGINEIISRRTLEETYLPQFEACARAGAGSFMASYPKVNGSACTNNEFLLRDILRDKMEFDGIIMSDWGACRDPLWQCVRSGLTLAMPGFVDPNQLVDAVNDGLIDEKYIDEAASLMINFANKYASVSDGLSREAEGKLEKDGDKIAYEIACEGIILLQNNGILPLCSGNKVKIEGTGANRFRDCGIGSAQVITSRTTVLAECLDDNGIGVLDEESKENPTARIIVASLPSSEGSDRLDLSLDERDIELLEEAVTNNIPTILVLNTPGPVDISKYVDKLEAIILVYYPGMMGSKALADIIAGRVNPSGKLTATWPKKYEDTPGFLCRPDNKSCIYGEGIFVGYRGYEIRRIEPLFGFGHGLSYTNFEFSNIRVKDSVIDSTEKKIVLKMTVTNTGKMAGSEVVQVYCRDVESTLNKPCKELVLFEKVWLEAGESKEVVFELGLEALMAFDEDFGKFLLEDGLYEFYVGGSLHGAEYGATVRVTCGSLEYKLGMKSTVLKILKYPEVLDALWRSIEENQIDKMVLTSRIRYTPFDRLEEIPEFEGKDMSTFLRVCETFQID